MNVRHLEYILEVYHCGSINKAAKYCYISQSHLSKIISDLEDELGFAIMHRSKAGLVFTRAGQLFIKSAEKIVAESNKIRHIPEQFASTDALSIACSPDSLLLHTFMDFEKMSPSEGASDTLKETGLREIMQMMINDECQMGLMVMFEQKAIKYGELADKYNLTLQALKTGIPMIAVMNPRHPLAKKEWVSVEDIGAYPFAVDANVDYDDTLGVLNIPTSHNVLYVTGLSSIEVALKKNNYITIETQTMKPYIASNGLCSRPIGDLMDMSGVYVLQQAHGTAFEREARFIAYLKDKLNKMFPEKGASRA